MRQEGGGKKEKEGERGEEGDREGEGERGEEGDREKEGERGERKGKKPAFAMSPLLAPAKEVSKR